MKIKVTDFKITHFQGKLFTHLLDDKGRIWESVLEGDEASAWLLVNTPNDPVSPTEDND